MPSSWDSLLKAADTKAPEYETKIQDTTYKKQLQLLTKIKTTYVN